MPLTMFETVKRHYAAARPLGNLRGYRQPLHPWKRILRDNGAIGAVMLYGLILGLLLAIFPVAFYLYLALPLVVLALLVIWVLPETGRYPQSFINRAFWLYCVSIFLWPNYLAIDLPGLPWITIQRFFLIPVTFAMLVGLSQSAALRKKVSNAYNASPLTFGALIAFVVIQTYTLPFGPAVSQAVSKYFSNQLVWTLAFLTAIVVFDAEEKVQRLVTAILVCSMVLTAISFLEARNEGVLWAEHVPSFLQVDSFGGNGPMAPSYRGATHLYRTKGTFSNPLLLAEILGIVTPFVLYAIHQQRNLFFKLALLVYLPAHFMAIRFTDGRLGILEFFGSILFYLLFLGIKYWRKHPKSLLGPSVVLAYPLGATGFMVLALTWTRLYRAMFGGGAQAASNEGRKAQWLAALPKVEAWPIGHGTSSSGSTLGIVGSNGMFTVDSYYITVLLEYGVLGFAVWLTLYISAIKTATQRYLYSDSDLMLPFATMLAMFLVGKSVLSLELINTLTFIALGIIVAAKGRWAAANAS